MKLPFLVGELNIQFFGMNESDLITISQCSQMNYNFALVYTNQWRNQPDNLVLLRKFQIIVVIHFFRN